MPYDKPLIAHKLQRWDQYITDYHLPQWDSIPDFGLYMDQVILLLERYLSFIPPVNAEKERIVTASAINNYVRLKLMPAPVKRKYYRVHICYLIMILTLKQSIGISPGARRSSPGIWPTGRTARRPCAISTRITAANFGVSPCSLTTRSSRAGKSCAPRTPAPTAWPGAW